MTGLGHTLARLVFNIRHNRRAIPDAFHGYERNPVALATDLRFKSWVRLAGLFGASLHLLAALCGTDKFGLHHYTAVYEKLMRPLRRQQVSVLELGVGGYAGSGGGESLLMWAAYFPKGRIYGVDIEDKTALSRGRIKVFQCSQTDRDQLTTLCEEIGPFDFIVDDGSHVNSHQIEAFRILWPFVKDGGSYVVEDVQTSYWPAFGGGTPGSPGYERSCMNYFKSLLDGINESEFLEPPQFETDWTIGQIAFHHNMIVVTKDMCRRTSNLPLDDEVLRSSLMKPAAG